jgi:hypothetical protein
MSLGKTLRCTPTIFKSNLYVEKVAFSWDQEDRLCCEIMGSKLCPKVILEGTRLTFKTEIALELNEHPRVVGPRKYRHTMRCTAAFRIIQWIRRGPPWVPNPYR